MDTIQDILRGFLTTEGRLQAALLLFMILWSLKNIRWINQHILTSDRAKLLTALLLAFAPAGAMMTDPSVPTGDAWYTFAAALLGAMGIQGGAKAVLGSHLKGSFGLGDRALPGGESRGEEQKGKTDDPQTKKDD